MSEDLSKLLNYSKFSVAAIQMTSCGNVGVNLMLAKKLMIRAVESGAKLLVLPESFALMPAKSEDLLVVAETLGDGRIQNFIAEFAKDNKVWVVGGTIPIKSTLDNRSYACCIAWDDQGKQVGCYNKIHLFDVDMPLSGRAHRESDSYTPGKHPVCIETPFGKIGLTVCYDLRFPELYRNLREQGADILINSAAFIQATGKVHWRPLLKARAIENQCYMIASNQVGEHDNNRLTHGESMIINPWGKVLAAQNLGVGVVIAEIDLNYLKILREDFPVWSHRRVETG